MTGFGEQNWGLNRGFGDKRGLVKRCNKGETVLRSKRVSKFPMGFKEVDVSMFDGFNWGASGTSGVHCTRLRGRSTWVLVCGGAIGMSPLILGGDSGWSLSPF